MSFSPHHLCVSVCVFCAILSLSVLQTTTLSAVFPSNVPAEAAGTAWWAVGSGAVRKLDCSFGHACGKSEFVCGRNKELKAIVTLTCFSAERCSLHVRFLLWCSRRLIILFPLSVFLLFTSLFPPPTCACASSHPTSPTLASQLLIISAAPTAEAALFLTLMIWAFQIWML